tara:strand:- start:342 stop:599 length:258 start_codon:yes stop_codon:yes gene_type:complete
MARHRAVAVVGGPAEIIPFTDAEEDSRDAEEAAWEAGKNVRAAMNELLRLEGQITPRRMRDHALGTGGDWLSDQEALIAEQRELL